MMFDNLAENGTLDTPDKAVPHLYSNVDEKKLQDDAASCLANYGTEFEPAIITGSKGLYVYTASGHRVLDWTSGQMSCLISHGHPEIVEVVRSHAANLDHLFSGMLSPPVINLAKRLTSALPPGLDRAFFLSTGGESNEAAIRLAKVYTGKFEVVGLGASWHGVTAQAIGVQFHAGRKGHGAMYTLPFVNIFSRSQAPSFPAFICCRLRTLTGQYLGTQTARMIGKRS